MELSSLFSINVPKNCSVCVKKNQLDAQLIGIQSNQDNRQSSKKNNKYQLLYTYDFTS